MSEEISAYLGYFPMRYMRLLDGSALKCLMLIFKMSKEYGKSYKDLEITTERQIEAGLNTLSFIRGIKKLEDAKIILVTRSKGKPFRVSLNENQMTPQDKEAFKSHPLNKCRVKKHISISQE